MDNLKYLFLKNTFLKGMSLVKIQKQFKVDRHRLSYLLKKEGITPVRNNQKFTYNSGVFKSIDTEESAYWLGFLFADGYVSTDPKYRLELALAEIDYEHVATFKNFVAPDKPLSKKVSFLQNRPFNSYKFYAINKELVIDLINHGCTPKKSSTLKFPTTVPDDLLKHFVRGYVDGDGHISIHKGKPIFQVSCGSIDFLNSLQNYFEKHVKGYSVVRITKDKRSNVFSLGKGGRPSVTRILEHLYGSSTVHLARKYNKFREIIQTNTAVS